MSVFLSTFCWISLQIPPASKASADVTNFVTEDRYFSKQLNASGSHVRGESLARCGFQCMRAASCVSFAINTSPEVPDCILYDTNLCDVTSNVELTPKDGYRMYDKDDRSSEKQTCLARQDNFKKCLENVQRFNITSNGSNCPLGFSFVGGVCYQVNSKLLNFSDAQNAANQKLRSRLAKLRDKGGQDLLVSLLKQAGVPQTQASGIWVGARNYGNGSNTSAIWRWVDGTPFNVSDTKGFLVWRTNQPDYSREQNGLMGPPDFCWSDVPFNVMVKILCQAPKPCPSQYTLNPNNNICYGLLPIASVIWQAPSHCSPPSSGASIKNYNDWQFIIGMIRNSALANDSFFTGISYVPLSNSFQFGDGSTVQEFGQWCQGQPDHIFQACVKLAFDSPSSVASIDDQFCKTEMASATEWIASSCSEWYQLGHRSNGQFRVLPAGTQVDIQVYCDMTTDGGGWTVIQARPGNSGTTFLRDITEYINGFGNVATDFWLGLDQMVLLTSQEMVNLLLTFDDASGRSYAIKYMNFQLSNNSDSPYTFTAGNFETASGLSDEFGKQQNVPFSVDSKKGGWWFASGSTVNFNGAPISNAVNSATTMQWSPDLLIKNTTMKIKSSTILDCLDSI